MEKRVSFLWVCILAIVIQSVSGAWYPTVFETAAGTMEPSADRIDSKVLTTKCDGDATQCRDADVVAFKLDEKGHFQGTLAGWTPIGDNPNPPKAVAKVKITVIVEKDKNGKWRIEVKIEWKKREGDKTSQTIEQEINIKGGEREREYRTFEIEVAHGTPTIESIGLTGEGADLIVDTIEYVYEDGSDRTTEGEMSGTTGESKVPADTGEIAITTGRDVDSQSTTSAQEDPVDTGEEAITTGSDVDSTGKPEVPTDKLSVKDVEVIAGTSVATPDMSISDIMNERCTDGTPIDQCTGTILFNPNDLDELNIMMGLSRAAPAKEVKSWRIEITFSISLKEGVKFGISITWNKRNEPTVIELGNTNELEADSKFHTKTFDVDAEYDPDADYKFYVEGENVTQPVAFDMIRVELIEEEVDEEEDNIVSAASTLTLEMLALLLALMGVFFF